MNFFQPLVGKMRVNLGCRDGGMSQNFLNRAQVRACGEKVGRHGMPQGVRGSTRGDANSFGILFYESLDGAGS